ncbi:MAG: DNA primase [Tannerellaceae bacterium]
MIDQITIDKILDAANIVDVVSEFVTLRKRGINMVGLCPFHSDKTPSFYVSPSKNICKCFACGEGGTAVHFIMKHEQLSYVEALKFLAKKYNIEVQERELSESERKAQSIRESLLIVNTYAQQYFSKVLHQHPEGKSIGLSYFKERGFKDEIIEKFQLGYSLEQKDAFYQEAIKAGYKKEYLEQTGLIIAKEDGYVADRFRGRVMFPVHTLSGKVVAFGGRVLRKDEKTAKYVNSPESEIYHKSRELYGLFFAKQAIVKSDRCFLVEGYTDVISMHQSGIENVVASSGTALTHGQIKLIHRFTNNITVIYDGDAAGIKAALRGIDLLLEEGINVKVVLLPEGEDPDSFSRKQSAASFIQYIEDNQSDFIRFKTNLLIGEAGNDPIKRSRLISDIVQSVAVIPDNIARSVYIRECSVMLEIDEAILINEVNKIRVTKIERENATRLQNNRFAANQPTATPNSLMGNDTYGVIPPDIPLPPMEEAPLPPTDNMGMQSAPKQIVRSAFDGYELALLRYVVRYGEVILFDYIDETTGQQVVYHVADYIKFDLERDDLHFQNSLYKSMLDEAASKINDEHFIANRYFLAHQDPIVSKLAANLVSDKYQLSKYHTKYREIENETDRLSLVVPRDIIALKDAYITKEIKDLQHKLKTIQQSGDMQEILNLMTSLNKMYEIKSYLAKELGERIVFNSNK